MSWFVLFVACAGRPVETTPAPTPVPSATPETPAPPPAKNDWPAACPSPTDPGVSYKHETWAGRDICAQIRFACGPDQEPLVSPPGVECGCGCIARRADDACDRDDECELVNKPCTCDMVVVNKTAGDRLRTEGATCSVTPSCAAPKSTTPPTCVDHHCVIAP